MFVLCIGMAVAAPAYESLSFDGVYPQGRKFPLHVYAFNQKNNDDRDILTNGFTIIHQYGNPSDQKNLYETAARYGIHTYGSLDVFLGSGPNMRFDRKNLTSPLSEEFIRERIRTMGQEKSIAWWDLPEELRYWLVPEMEIFERCSRICREADALQRPRLMYIPTHYGVEETRKYIHGIDIVPASVYTTYVAMPHIWARWRMRVVIDAIAKEQAVIGPDYPHGQKTPIAILELCYLAKKNPIMTPAGAWHDLWACIAEGAQGISIYSYARRNDHPDLIRSWEMFVLAARLLSEQNGIGEAILFGERMPSTFTITHGPAETESFIPFFQKDITTPLAFPSVVVRSMKWKGRTYFIAVNSANAPVAVQINVAGASDVTTIGGGTSVAVRNNVAAAVIEPLGVRIFYVEKR